ncbi:hypothetical protein [Alkalihalobacillus sp. BA299]|uniref:hypothetical protein n=1 Tax=Alkalihalobacillus sp. BA299 TaxID=2815938 RepID=UPI001AD98C1B|nr:hypothetical protein [Alkalihalobacillus sp. BA299]
MDKSDLLDEIRLEVGLVTEYANSQSEFYHGIIEAFGKYIIEGYSVGIYLTDDISFQLVSSVGSISYETKEFFGHGHLSLCAIKGHISTIDLGYSIRLFAPFYENHHLIGILVFHLPKMKYQITEEDLIFVQEICRHIELNQNQYSN